MNVKLISLLRTTFEEGRAMTMMTTIHRQDQGKENFNDVTNCLLRNDDVTKCILNFDDVTYCLLNIDDVTYCVLNIDDDAMTPYIVLQFFS